MAQLPRRVEVLPFEGDADSFPVWSRRFRGLCRLQGWGDVLDIANIVDGNVGGDESAHVHNLLSLSLLGRAATLATRAPDGNGRALWRLLVQEYAPADALALQRLREELFSVHFDGDVEIFLDNIETARDKIRVTGQDPDDHNEQLCARVAKELPTEYMAGVLPILTHAQADRRADWNGFSHTVRGMAKYFKSTNNGVGIEARALSVTKITCYACGKPGHKRYQCPNRGSEAGPARKNSQDQRGRRDAPRGDGQHKRKPGAFHAAVEDEETTVDEGHAVCFAVFQDAETTAPTVSINSKTGISFILDSGASDTIVSPAIPLSSIRAVRKHLITANGSCVVENMGNIAIDVEGQPILVRDALVVPGAKQNLLSVGRLVAKGHRVDFDPQHPRITLSTGKTLSCRRQGHLVYLDAHLRDAETDEYAEVHEAHEIHENAEVHEVAEIHEIHEIDEHAEIQESAASAAAAAASNDNDAVVDDAGSSPADGLSGSAMLWHRRLGHANFQVIRKMGVTVPTDASCTDCAVGKSAHASISRAPVALPEYPGAITYSDVAGPFTPTSLSGKKYIVVFIDGATRFAWLYLMANVSEVVSHFRTFVRDAQAAGIVFGSGSLLHADNASVYRGRSMAEVLGEFKMTLRTSPPYTPQRNGVAERFWRSTVDAARVLVAAAKLPKTWWGAAVLHACFVRNVLPTTAHADGASPHEKLTGNRFDVSTLRVFGCLAYVHVERRNKLDDKARPATYVGHSTTCNSGIFVVRSLSGQLQTIESVHVRFFEDHYSREAIGVTSVSSDIVPATRAIVTELPARVPAPQQPPVVPAQAAPAPVVPDAVPADSSDSDNNSDDVPAPAAGPGPNADGTYNIDRIDGEKRVGVYKQYRVWWTGYADPSWSWREDIQHTDAYREYLARCREQRTAADADSDDGDGAATLATSVPFDGFEAFAFALFNGDTDEPRSLREAKASPEWTQWKDAVDEELHSIAEQGTWSPVENVPKGARVLSTKLIFKKKRDEHGRVTRYKARLVVRGYLQKQHIDYDDAFAPVVSRTTVRMVFAIAAAGGLIFETVDIKTAFLNGAVDYELYVTLPKELAVEGQRCVFRLHKALYGLKQASRLWNTALDDALRGAGFRRSKVDPCLYVDENQTYIVVWVDDVLIVSPLQARIDAVKRHLAGLFTTRDLGPTTFYVGMRVTRTDGAVALSQRAYIEDLLLRHGMQDCRPATTPLPGGWSVATATSDAAGGDLLDAAGATQYRSIVGGIMYACCCTRPDLSFASSSLAQLMSAPTSSALAAAKHALRYLSATVHLSLIYRRIDGSCVATAYADATFASTPDARSISGYVLMINGAPLSWKSKRQTSVALSSAEAEYASLSEAAREVLFVRGLLADFGFPQPATVVHQDNQPAIHLAENAETTARTRHFNVALHHVRDLIAAGVVVLRFCPTQMMIADGFTKSLPRARLEEHRAALLG